MKPKVSVIIPCYNVEKYVAVCLDSLLQQTYGRENLELICVDDCSTDSTVEILQRYEVQYPQQLLLVLSEKNGRQGTARNIGMQYATGDYVSFVDADDWVAFNMYELLVGAAQRDDCDIVQFRLSFDADEVRSVEGMQCRYYEFETRSQRLELLLSDDILNQSCTSKLYKRKLLLESGVRYAEHVFYEEPLFTYPLKFYVRRVCRTEAPLMYYRCHGGNTTIEGMKSLKSIGDHLFVQHALYQRMRATEFYAQYREEIELFFVHSFAYEALSFLSMRKIEIPAELGLYILSTIEMEAPAWRENRYLTVGSSERKTMDLLLSIRQEKEDKD